jgi:hypothetical protein
MVFTPGYMLVGIIQLISLIDFRHAALQKKTYMLLGCDW